MSHSHGHSDEEQEIGSSCSSSLSGQDSYDLSLHIASVFIIAIVSYLGTVPPLLVKKIFSVRSLIYYAYVSFKKISLSYYIYRLRVFPSNAQSYLGQVRFCP